MADKVLFIKRNGEKEGLIHTSSSKQMLKWTAAIKESRNSAKDTLEHLQLTNLRSLKRIIDSKDVNAHLNFYERNDDKSLLYSTTLKELKGVINTCIANEKMGYDIFVMIG